MLVELQVAKLCSPIPNEVEKDRAKIVFGLLDAGLHVVLNLIRGSHIRPNSSYMTIWLKSRIECRLVFARTTPKHRYHNNQDKALITQCTKKCPVFNIGFSISYTLQFKLVIY